MAFLRGTMTYEQLKNGKLFKLLAGEVSDDFGVTAPVGEAWERVDPNRLAAPGTELNTPTNINQIGMWLNFKGETKPQQAVSFTISGRTTLGATLTESPHMRLQVFTNGSLVNDTDLLAYWISITKDRIIMAIQGDTAHSGNMNLMYIGTYQRLYNATIDPFPVLFAVTHLHENEYYYSYNHYHPRAVLAKVDGTGWLDDRDTNELALITISRRVDANPNTWDNKWYLYTIYILGNKTNDTPGNLGYRGKMLDFYTLDNNGWSNRDILTDGVTSWRLIAPFHSNSTATELKEHDLGNSKLYHFAFKQI